MVLQLGVDTAAGQNIDIQIIDQFGATVTSTLTDNTANTKQLQVNTAGDPASNQVTEMLKQTYQAEVQRIL
jgi:hypothetical protein